MSSILTLSTVSVNKSPDRLPAPPPVLEPSPSAQSPFFTTLDTASSIPTAPKPPTEWLQSAPPPDRDRASLHSSSLSSDPADDPYDYVRRYELDPATDCDSTLSVPAPEDAPSFAAPLHLQPGPRQRSASLRAAANAAAHAPASITSRTRRHLSKLSYMASRRDSDAESVLSEPASYSNSSYVASDMWLVHRDVDNAERMLKQKERERERERERHRPKWDSPRARAVSAAGDLRNADVFSPRNEAQDVSSKLVRMFFSGETASPIPTHKPRHTQEGTAQRPRSRFGYSGRGTRASGHGFEQQDHRFDGSTGLRSFDGWDGEDRKKPLRQNRDGDYVDAFGDNFGGYHKKRRFDKARRFRWWMRRLAFKLKGEAE